MAASVASVVALAISIEYTAVLSGAATAIFTVAVPTATVLSFIPVALFIRSLPSSRPSCPSGRRRSSLSRCRQSSSRAALG